MRETVIEVEYPLVESQLKELDEQLEKAIHQLNWTSEGMHRVHIFYVHPANKHVECDYKQIDFYGHSAVQTMSSNLLTISFALVLLSTLRETS